MINKNTLEKLIEHSKSSTHDIWPLTIVSDRYGGSYSGANYLAFNLDETCLPWPIDSSDSACQSFWWKYNEEPNFPIGRGATVQAAFDDLYQQLEKIKK